MAEKVNLEDKRPKVGTGIFIIRDGKTLFGKRKGNGEGFWCPPGGHLEFGESVEDCMTREALEESGVKIKNVRLGPYVNNVDEDAMTHYLVLFGVADYEEGEAALTEPDSFYEWRWVNWENLPEPLFSPIRQFIQEGHTPFGN